MCILHVIVAVKQIKECITLISKIYLIISDSHCQHVYIRLLGQYIDVILRNEQNQVKFIPCNRKRLEIPCGGFRHDMPSDMTKGEVPLDRRIRFIVNYRG